MADADISGIISEYGSMCVHPSVEFAYRDQLTLADCSAASNFTGFATLGEPSLRPQLVYLV